MTLQQKLEALAALVEKESIERLREQGSTAKANYDAQATHVHMAAKYARIDKESMGKLMVDLATGEIFGIKGYGRVHKGHAYGTLDTIDEWYWGDFYPRKKQPAAH